MTGLKLPDPLGPWPISAVEVADMTADADGDGKPGLTLLPKSGAGYSLPPTNLLMTERADEVYSSSRLKYVATVPDPDCADTLEGTAELKVFDQLVLGCRVKDRGECTPAEADFFNRNRSTFQLGAGTWSGKTIADTASCADVRAALPVPAPL